MKDDNAKRLRANRVWLTADACDLEEFKSQVERSLNRADYPFASDVESNVLVYDGLEARKAAASPESRKELLAEWVDAFTDGPGIIVIRNAFPDLTAIDSPTRITGRSSRKSARATSAAAIISPSQAPMTASGTRSRSCACATLRSSLPITATQSSRW